MHRALLLAARMVQRAQASVAYHALTDCHPRTAKDLVDLATELDGLGYIDPIEPARDITPPRRNTLRLQTVEEDDYE